MKNGYKGNGSAARRILMGGVSPTNGTQSRVGYGGGPKKGGSGPTATGFLKPYYNWTRYPTGPGNVNAKFSSKTSSRPFGPLQYVNAY